MPPVKRLVPHQQADEQEREEYFHEPDDRGVAGRRKIEADERKAVIRKPDEKSRPQDIRDTLLARHALPFALPERYASEECRSNERAISRGVEGRNGMQRQNSDHGEQRPKQRGRECEILAALRGIGHGEMVHQGRYVLFDDSFFLELRFFRVYKSD